MPDIADYILAGSTQGKLYIGVSDDLAARMAEHTQRRFDAYTKRYCVKTLVYCEYHAALEEAAARQQRLKGWHRPWKHRIVESMNPAWRNVYDPGTGKNVPGLS